MLFVTTMEPPAQEPPLRQPSQRQQSAGKCASVLVGMEAAVIAGFAAYYAFELLLGQGSDPVVVIMSIVTMAVFVIGLSYVSVGLWQRHPRSQAPAVAFNGLMIPLGIALSQIAPVSVATLVLAAGVAVVASALAMGQLD